MLASEPEWREITCGKNAARAQSQMYMDIFVKLFEANKLIIFLLLLGYRLITWNFLILFSMVVGTSRMMKRTKKKVA